jgi:hypothetical protein
VSYSLLVRRKKQSELAVWQSDNLKVKIGIQLPNMGAPREFQVPNVAALWCSSGCAKLVPVLAVSPENRVDFSCD